MAEVVDLDDCEEQMKIIVKSLKEKKDIILGVNGTVKQLKEIITREFSASAEQLCLIYAGKILGDGDHLSKYSIKDGTTVHLVIKSANKETEGQFDEQGLTPQRQEPVNIAATPFGLGNIGGLIGLSNLGFGSANFMDLQQRLQNEAFTNPDMLRNLMDNPMVQQLMANPQVLQSMLAINPQMRELMEGNPEISNVLGNPELLQQAFSVARNPAMMQELIRAAAIAGGTEEVFNVTPRLYRDPEEPTSNAGSATTTTASSAANPAMNSAGVRSVVQQMIQNPQLMNNLMQAPYMQSMMQALALPNNSQLLEQYMGNNPLIAGSPEIQESVRSALPYLSQQLVNPEVQALMGNPRALQAMLDIQQGMQQLQNEAPGLVMGAQSGLPGDTTGSGDQAAAAAAPPGDQYSQMLAQMFRTMSGSVNNGQDVASEVRFESQLNQLMAMGFVNRQANLDALALTSGNVNAAIDKLLQMK